MSTKTKVIIGVVVLALIGGVAAFVVIGSKGAGVEVEVGEATERDLSLTVIGSGRVEAGASADIFPPVAGTLARVLVSDGESVTAGTVIAEMDVEPIEVQLTQARAGLAQARAALANVDAQGGGAAAIAAAVAQQTAAEQAYTAAKSGQTAAEAGWALAKAALAAANPAEVATYTALSLSEKQSHAAYLSAVSGVAQAYAAVQGAKVAVTQARSLDPEAQKDAAQAAVAQAQGAVALLEQQLDDATLVAPIGGIVVFNNTASALSAAAGGTSAGGGPGEGSVVSPQSAPFTVVDLDALTFVADVDEAEIDGVRPGMSARVELDSFPADPITSTVTRVVPLARTTATGGTVFSVEIAITDPAQAVLLGMKGEASIEVESKEAVLTIPVQSLFSEGGKDYVLTIEDGVLVKTFVTVGAETDTDVEVLEGLESGDEVVLAGAVTYTEGTPVRVKQ